MAAAYTNDQLVACARREVAKREQVYPRLEKKEAITDCSQKNQDEHAMMQLIADQLAAIPELQRRYNAAKAVIKFSDEALELSQPEAMEIQRHANNAAEGRYSTHDVVNRYNNDVPALLADRAMLIDEIFRLRSLLPQ